MYFGIREIQELISSAIRNSKGSLGASLKLLYYLKFPKEDVPRIIARTICDNETYILNQDQLGKSLAGVHIDELSKIIDEELLVLEQSIISRQINRIALFLEEEKAPSTINYAFQEISKHLLSINALIKDISNSELFYPAKATLLIEEALQAILIDKDLGISFLEHNLKKLNSNKAKEVLDILNYHLKKLDIPESTAQILNPHHSSHLTQELVNNPNFQTSVTQLFEILEAVSPKNSSVIV